MSPLSHVVWIDESGNGKFAKDGMPVPGIQSLWVSAAVCFEWERLEAVSTGVQEILRDRFLNRCRELKASHLRRYLPAEYGPRDIGQDVARLVQSEGGHVWITGTRAGSQPMFSHPRGRGAEAKEKTRQLLIERISGYATPRFFEPGTWVMVWDVDDAGSLGEFSAAIAAFRNRVSGHPLPAAITPSMLGGLSHEWTPIQVADIYANFALHKIGIEQGLVDAKTDRATAFDEFLEPTLKRDRSGRRVGWKVW